MKVVDVTARAEELAQEIATVLRALVAEVSRKALTEDGVRAVVREAVLVFMRPSEEDASAQWRRIEAIANRVAEQLGGRALPSTSEHDPCAVDLAECRRLAGVARALADIRHASITDLAREMLISAARQLEAAAVDAMRAQRGDR